MAAALLCDWLFGEPRRWHPLIGFGRLARAAEGRLYGGPDLPAADRRRRGVAAVTVLLLPFTALAAVLAMAPVWGTPFSAFMLYAALGHRSLHDHARAVTAALSSGDEQRARLCASYMVSRDKDELDIAPATIESVLENGNDAVLGALFWFAVAGAPGAVLYRLANTLDAMWGYRNERYHAFGWAAAKLDDVLNYLPARLTACSYALMGRTRAALTCWRTQAALWKSPNAGPVMAAGAGALEVTLGGPACYGGEWEARPALGTGRAPGTGDVERALRLVRRTVWLWLFVICGGALLYA
ncbi:MAG: cobalamin biosynthesis protein [Alphaproteobacteria bacterium]|nr:cobalamin biosynthesis protein [Alphaproteobacteria bacterium]